MSEFEQAFLEAINAPNAMSASGDEVDSLRVGGVFADLVESVIAKVGLAGLTRDQFVAIVLTAFDIFAAGLNMPDFVKAMLRKLVEVAAGRIWDKRHQPTPTPTPA